MIPPGSFLITQKIFFPTTAARIAVEGDGQNVSVIYARECDAFDFAFAQNGAQQPYGVVFRNIGIRALGKCGTGIRISYGHPNETQDHNQPSSSLSNVMIASDGEGSWDNGVELEGAWNVTLDNVFASGDSCGGNYWDMRGAGIVIKGMCVNIHLTNVRCNFFADGVLVKSDPDRNTEGLFFANCSMVAVKRGLRFIGSITNATKRISTLTWVGGLIECRVLGVTDGSAAFDLKGVWTALIGPCQMLSESINTGPYNTYGVSAVDCHGVVVAGADINAWRFGVATSGDCRAISNHGNTFTNCGVQTVFNIGTTGSRSYGHVLVNNAPNEEDLDGSNKIGFVN